LFASVILSLCSTTYSCSGVKKKRIEMMSTIRSILRHVKVLVIKYLTYILLTKCRHRTSLIDLRSLAISLRSDESFSFQCSDSVCRLCASDWKLLTSWIIGIGTHFHET